MFHLHLECCCPVTRVSMETCNVGGENPCDRKSPFKRGQESPTSQLFPRILGGPREEELGRLPHGKPPGGRTVSE